MNQVCISVNEQRVKLAKEMEVGEVGTVIDSSYQGKTILRAFDSFICLQDPMDTWTPSGAYRGPKFKVEILPPGSILTITLGEKANLSDD